MADSAPPLSAVLLAHAIPADEHGAVSSDAVQRAVAAARAAGGSIPVIVLRDGASAPHDARVVRVKSGAAWISAVRTGMAVLANTPARLALVWTPAFDDADTLAPLRELVEAAERTRATITAVSADTLTSGPVIVARDAWLELLTLGEQGMHAIVARRGVHYLLRT